MSFQRTRRALLGAACLSGLLAACGGGEVESQLQPRRLVVFGDGFADLGQGGSRYTINDGTVNNWTAQLAQRYGLSLAPSSAGGTSYATGNARVVAEPDAAGSTATPTVAEQIDAFFAGGGSFAENDLVVVAAGIADIVAEVGQTQAGAQTAAQAQADIAAAGTALGNQVRRLVNAGARHVTVVGPYNLGRTPWAIATNQKALLESYTTRFNDSLLISIVDLGARVLYVDAALYYNLVTAGPGGYGLSNVTEAACTSVDPGPGIGIGAGQVNSALCTPDTVRSGIDRNAWFFADAIYPSPAAQRLFGDYAYDRIRARW
ncbi:SGNH/GDSL hydrolase family protein [Ramlibacter rhizophilus]|uniref:GDSL family lipase n=1 Tax=Ramlibacter rhizophilus TaxID=1781167 RepID=A0A4Z0BHB1_9BURK|nr:SGNH/GDSL hydrolase family protein [Ramlibacter rhizophilus]TFY97853.1 GDSL family lipase [Ramlibacter rhizophilus]